MIGTWKIRRCMPWLSRGIALACLLAFSFATNAFDPIILTTRSKQFTVRGRPQLSSYVASKPDLVYVDPALLSLVCERVREALQQELGWGEHWRDPVFINVQQTFGRKQRPYIEAIPTGGKGWRYRIEMPEEVTRREFIQPLVQVLLLEYANRGAHEESVEVPLWLVEGMTEQLMSGPLAGLTLRVNTVSAGQVNTLVPLKPNSYTVRVRTNDNAIAVTRAKVQARGALTVDQLTWPEFKETDQAAIETYRASAHLFLRELLRLQDGADALCASLALLPESLNWQTAFLRAFDAHFTRMLEVEKWWSLVLVQAKGRDTSIQWSPRESEARLEDVLYTPMQVRLKADELPIVTPVAIQTLVSEWAFRDQEQILRNKLNQLSALRARVPQEFAVLADEYRVAIESYLTARSAKKMIDRDPSSRQVKALLKQITTALETLDRRRAQLNAAFAKGASQLARGNEFPPESASPAGVNYEPAHTNSAR
jgi:hypothetical protein